MEEKSEAITMVPRATKETGLLGKGSTSTFSSAPEGSSSSCQAGKVARRRSVINARGMAVNLI